MSDHAHQGCCGTRGGGDTSSRPDASGRGAAIAAEATVQDPVCGMSVDPARSRAQHEHAGRTYHFCCGGCRAKFAADPDRYLGAGSPANARD